MRNLLQETIGKSSIEEFAKKIVWARINCTELPPNHSPQEAIDFLKSLNFDYDNGWGAQHVYGTIMLNDSTWMERAEYDGSEWWERRTIPTW